MRERSSGRAFSAASRPAMMARRRAVKSALDTPASAGQIPASGVVAEDDGTVPGYYTVGSVYVFGSTLTLPRDPLYGQSNLELLTPQTSIDLSNGQNVTSTNGAAVTQITLGFSARAQDDVERARRLARIGPAWLDLDIASERWRQWPVRSVAERVTRSVARINAERVELPFRELA